MICHGTISEQFNNSPGEFILLNCNVFFGGGITIRYPQFHNNNIIQKSITQKTSTIPLRRLLNGLGKG